MRRIMRWVVGSLLVVPLTIVATDDPTPTEALGAAVYVERCQLCHGKKGRGDGVLPRRLDNYPNTKLSLKDYSTEELRDEVITGGMNVGDSTYSPPWGEELSWLEIESVVLFLELWSTRKVAAMRLIRKANQSVPIAKHAHPGRAYYISYCALCHGEYGAGDGQMAKVINSPPPYKLTQSRVPESYLRMIIERGGAGVGRSIQMPPWKDEFTSDQLDSIVDYVLTLRIEESKDAIK